MSKACCISHFQLTPVAVLLLNAFYSGPLPYIRKIAEIEISAMAMGSVPD